MVTHYNKYISIFTELCLLQHSGKFTDFGNDPKLDLHCKVYFGKFPGMAELIMCFSCVTVSIGSMVDKSALGEMNVGLESTGCSVTVRGGFLSILFFVAY